jgi:hypothetical protein
MTKGCSRPSAPRIRHRFAAGRPARETLVLQLRITNARPSTAEERTRLPSPVDFNPAPLVRPLVAAFRLVCGVTHSRAAANPVPLPKPKPRAMREQFVVPSIRSPEVARAQRSGVRRCEDALQVLDFGNRLLDVHSSQYHPAWVWQSSNRTPTIGAELLGLAHIPPAVHGDGLPRHVVIHGKHDGDRSNVLH